jgi:hypothetical protein
MTHAPALLALGALVIGAACTPDSLRGSADAGHDHSNPQGWPLGPDCGGCTREMLGKATWLPARVVLFSANIGPSGELARPLMESLLPLHRFDADANAFLTRTEHAPPYDDELYQGLDARGIAPSQAFDDVQLNSPQAVMIAMTVVPSEYAPYMGTTDYVGGPAITSDTFPIAIGADVNRGGRSLAHLDTVVGRQPADLSHFVIAIPDNSSILGAPFVPPDGDYDVHLRMTDTRGAGWDVWVPFQVGSARLGPSAVAGRIALVPDANGFLGGSNAAGVHGRWWASGDAYGADGTLGAGVCPTAGYSLEACSTLTMPTPGQPFLPSQNGMCTAGVAAQVINSDWNDIRGDTIGFNLAEDADGNPGPYDAVAHKITGFAFEIDNPPPDPAPGGHLRIEFPTVTVHDYPAYWGGAMLLLSPLRLPGHYEIRWADVGGPVYRGQNLPFDPTGLTAIRFVIAPTNNGPVPFDFCINNVALLTD